MSGRSQLAASAAISAGVHAAVAAYLASQPPSLPARHGSPPLEVEVIPRRMAAPTAVSSEIVPMTLVITDERVPAAPRSAVPTREAPAATPAATPAAGPTAEPAVVTVDVPGQADGPTPSPLAMRDPHRAGAVPDTPSPGAPTPRPSGPLPGWLLTDAQRVLRGIRLEPAPPAPPPRSPLAPPTPRKPPKPRSELRPDNGGTFQADDLAFAARVGRDGAVRFEDKRNLNAHVNLPTLKKIARAVETWLEDPYGSATAGQHPYSRFKHARPPPGQEAAPAIGGSFDLTDWAMRSSGQDPYQRRKAEFLDRTRAERMQIAANSRSEDLREATSKLSVRLVALWRHDEWSPGERRALLFELWDECAESGPGEVVDAADEVRRTIERFIRRVLPEGSADAYSADELARFNARRTSTRVFAPYEQL